MAEPSPETRYAPGIGCLSLSHRLEKTQIDCVHDWLTSPHAGFWAMQHLTPSQTAAYIASIQAADTHAAWIGRCNGQPAFFFESYDPSAEPIGQYYPVEPGDAGMHILIAPPTQRIHLFTWAVFAFAVDTLFRQSGVRRLVVEPDVDNVGIHRLNKRAGFVYHRRLALADKTAWLTTCTPDSRRAAAQRLGLEQRRVSGFSETSL